MTPKDLQEILTHGEVVGCELEFGDVCHPERLTALRLDVEWRGEHPQTVRLEADYDGYREEAPYLTVTNT